MRVYKQKDNRRLTIFWDTETIGFAGESVSSQFCYMFGDDNQNESVLYEGYDCIENTLQHVKRLWLDFNKPVIVMYAHNAAFDLMRIKGQVENTVFRAVLVAGQLIAGKLIYDDLTINCRDSIRLLPDSLAKLTSSLSPDLPKLQMNHDIGYEIGNPVDQDYAKRDVISMRAVLLNFATLADIPFEKLKFSAAGQSFNMAKKLYETDNGKYYPAPKEFNQLMLKHYYYGGRIYIRYNHNPLEITNCESLDITSSYPNQMEKQIFPLPGKLPRIFKRIPSSKGRYFIRAWVKDYNHNLPILPYRTFDPEGKTLATYYPHGDFETHLSDIEYEFIKKHQPEQLSKLEIRECLFWKIDDCKNWLKPYIDKYYGLKQKGDELNEAVPGSGDGLRTVGKTFLNALYGKFAQKYIDDGGEQVGWGTGNEDLEVFDNHNQTDHRNAHISAFITAGARIHLYEAIIHYGIDNVLYGDTDSVKVLEDVYHNTPKMADEGDYLGSWKREGLYKNLQVIAPKVYIGEYDNGKKTKLDIKTKGMPLRGFTAIKIGKDVHRFKRSKGSENSQTKNEAIDNKVCVLIAEAAKTLEPISVAYDDKPVKLKTFLNSGLMAYKAVKTMSYPDSVKGMDFDGTNYSIKVIKNEK